jgi:hypothetical protein
MEPMSENAASLEEFVSIHLPEIAQTANAEQVFLIASIFLLCFFIFFSLTRLG